MTTNPSPMLIAHRGASADFPENTQIAFEQACLQGIDGIELDLQMTQDGEIVVYHDHWLDKLGHDQKPIHMFEWNDLKDISIGRWFSEKYNDQKMMTLNQTLNLFGGRTSLLLEIKARERPDSDTRHPILINKVIETVKSKKLTDDIMILCFNFKVLQEGFKNHPQIRYILNRDCISAEDLRDLPTIDFLYGISTDIKNLKQSDARHVRENNKHLIVYSCNTKKELKQAFECQANVIMTDKPKWALSEIKNM